MQKVRLDYLDSIRAIAIILVILQHVILHLKRDNLLDSDLNLIIATFLTDFIDLGKIGVGLFFILSGFVISFSLKEGNKLKYFYIKRFFRLYPIFWISIFFGVVILWDNIPSFSLILANITMLPNLFQQELIIGVYWTLQIELIFYILIGILFQTKYLYNENKIFLVSIFFLLIAFIFSCLRFYLEKKIPVALPLALSIMFFGSMFMNYIILNSKKFKKFIIIYIYIFVITMPFISYLAYNINFGFDEKWYRYLLSYYIAFFLFILMVTKMKIFNKYLVYLGVISYSLYLFHPLVIKVLTNFQLDTYDNLLFLLLTISISIIVSSITYWLLEIKIINMVYKFLKGHK